ncbi:hypothetical protein [Sulfurimonas sp.]
MKTNLLTIILLTTLSASLYADENHISTVFADYHDFKSNKYAKKLEERRDIVSKSRDARDEIRSYQELRREYLSLSI